MKRHKWQFLSLMVTGLFTLNTTVMAQTKNYKVITKTVTSESINVSADSLWSILRAFDKTAEWTSTLKHSEGHGPAAFEGANCNARVCEANIKGQDRIVEELTFFSDTKRELAYNLTEGAPKIVKFASNHWKVMEISPNQSKVQMNVTMHLSKFTGFFLGGLITWQMEKQVKIVQNELKIYAETGEVSEAKKKQLEAL